MNESHDQLLAALLELHRRYPNWRFGQLVSNAAGWADENVWDVEDCRLLAAVNEHLTASAQLRERIP